MWTSSEIIELRKRDFDWQCFKFTTDMTGDLHRLKPGDRFIIRYSHRFQIISSKLFAAYQFFQTRFSQFYSRANRKEQQPPYCPCKSVHLAEIQEQTPCIGCTPRIIGTNCFLQSIEWMSHRSPDRAARWLAELSHVGSIRRSDWWTEVGGRLEVWGRYSV